MACIALPSGPMSANPLERSFIISEAACALSSIVESSPSSVLDFAFAAALPTASVKPPAPLVKVASFCAFAIFN